MTTTHNTTQKKSTVKGAIAGAAVAALLLAGGGTFALWSDQATISGGTITSGDLQVAALGGSDLSWYDGTDAVDLDTFRIVPGDSITATQDLAVALEGDNLRAQLGVDGAGTGALLGDPDGVQLTFSVIDGDGTVLASDVPFGELAQLNVGPTGSGADLEVPSSLPITANVKVAITASFSDTTADRDFTDVSATLDALQVTLQQVRA